MQPLHTLLTNQKTYFATGATLSYRARRDALRALAGAIETHKQQLFAALHADLGKSESEAFLCEVGLTLSEIGYLQKHLRSWMRPRRHLTGLPNFPARSYTVRNPYGSVLILAPWNYPVLLTLEPLAGALAAGNCCVVKPSAYAPETSRALATLIRDTFPPELVAVVEGGRAKNSALLELPFDYLFFTGGVTVGRLVMEKAAAHLTPFTLELGGKSPCIVDRTANLKLAARRIAFGKYLNCGQTCVAPDYLLIDRTVKDRFLQEFRTAVQEMYGEDPLQNPNYGRIVNRKHFDRLCGLLAPHTPVLGGATDEAALRIAPTVLDNVSPDDPVMQEELFGPILPVLSFDRPEQVTAFLRERPHPLACYLFSNDKTLQKTFRDVWQFGGGCINDTVIHLATSRMPFGGVGQSGIGQYHGKHSFDTFTHIKSTLRRAPFPDVPVRYQPYSRWKDRLSHLFLR